MTLILSGTNGVSDIDGDASTPAIRGSDSNTGIFFGTDIIGFSEGGTECGRFNASGNLQTIGTISVGNATPSTSGAGITFPATQSASSDANTLDDYEEGTWTPALTFGGNSVSLTYTNRVGHYVRIGKVVYISFAISLSNKGSSSGSAYVTGMPFATQSQSLNQFFGLLTCASNVSSWQVGASWGLMFSDSNIYLRYNQASGEGSLNESNFTNTSNFGFTGFYFV